MLRSSEYNVPSILHHGPILEFQPTMLLIIKVCYYISASSSIIELIILHPSCILAYAPIDTFGPIYKTIKIRLITIAVGWISAVGWINTRPIFYSGNKSSGSSIRGNPILL